MSEDPAPTAADRPAPVIVRATVAEAAGARQVVAGLSVLERSLRQLARTPDRRIILGGYDEPFRDPRARDALLGRKVVALRRRFHQLFPRIPLEVATAWAGTFGRTADGLPFIGEHPCAPRTWFALGYGGNGITYSRIAAELIRSAFAGESDADADLYAFKR